MTARAWWARAAYRLVVATAVYNAIEAVVALWAGLTADSVALIGFGFDSGIELAAAIAVLTRMQVELHDGDRNAVATVERRVRRFVGWTFFALAGYIVLEAGLGLWYREAPAESPVGIGLAVVSLVVMPLIAWGKLRAAAALESRALAAEAKETLACAYLSATLLAGLSLHALFGWWWADAVAALAMVPWLVHEGKEALEDDPCP